MDEARACKALAGAYNILRNQFRALQYIARAIALATEDLEERETRSSLLFLSDCHAKRADFCSSINAANPYALHMQALADQEKVLDCIRRLREAYPQEDNRLAYCIACQQAGKTLTEIGGQENTANLRKALDYYQKAYELADALNKENHDLDSCMQLADCCEKISEILTALGREKYSKEILHFLSKELGYRARIFLSNRTRAALHQLAQVYALRGKHLLREFHDRRYVRHLNPSIPLQQQEISRKTTALIATLTVNYWTVQHEEEELLTSFENNQKKHVTGTEPVPM